MMKIFILLLVSSLFLTAKEICYTVQIASKKDSIESQKELKEQSYPDSCKMMEIKKNQVIRCGCTKTKKEIIKIFKNLKPIYTDAYLTRTYSYRFEEKTQIVIKEKKTPPIQKQIQKIIPKENNETITVQEKTQIVIEEKKTLSVKTQELPIYSVTKPINGNDISKKDIFIGFSMGYTMFDISIDGTLLNNKLSDDGITYNLEMGYYIFNNLFLSLDYQYTILDNSNFNAISPSINYQFDSLYSISPYIGILAGINMMEWEKSPIEGVSLDKNNFAFFSGIKLGGDIYINDSWSIFLAYKFIKSFNATLIKVNSEVTLIEYDTEHDFQLGIKYKF